MPGPEQCCGGLVPAEKGKRTAVLLRGGRGPGWIRPGPLSTQGLCRLRPWLGTCGGTQISFFLSFSALDCQQSLWAGVLPQRGGAAALEQRQHWLHLAWGPLHLRRLLGKRERSPGRTRVAAVGGRHVRGVMPLRRQHAGWTRVCSQDFHFLSPKGCGGDDDRIKQWQNVAQQMHFLLISGLESSGLAGISSGLLWGTRVCGISSSGDLYSPLRSSQCLTAAGWAGGRGCSGVR